MRTDFLFAVPSLLSGAARVLDLAGKYDRYNESRTTREADLRALFCDYFLALQDLREGRRSARSTLIHEQAQSSAGAAQSRARVA